MGQYDDEIAMAQELIAELGTTLTITRRIPAAPASGDRPATAPVKIVATCSGVILTPKMKQKGADGIEPGTLVQSSERIVYVAAEGITVAVTGGTFTDSFEPTALDQLLISGRNFVVRWNDPLAPDGTSLILHRTIVTA